MTDTNNDTTPETTTTTDSAPLSTDNITAALAKTKAAKKAAAEGDAPAAEATPKKPRLSDEEKAIRDQQRTAQRAADKAVRDAARAEKKAAKLAEKSGKVAHMSKVDKAAKNLPPLSSAASALVATVEGQFDESETTAIIAHLTHYLRATATATALGVKLTENQLVRITSAEGPNARYVGHLAHVISAQRIRCYVKPVGTDKKVYLFSSNVTALSDEEVQAVEQSSSEDALAAAV